MQTQTAIYSEINAVLAVIWLVLAGAMQTRSFVFVAVFKSRAIGRTAFSGCLTELLRWIVLACITLTCSALDARALSPDTKRAVGGIAETRSSGENYGPADDVTRLFLQIVQAAKKPLPAWILDSAVRVYSAYRIHRIGKDVENATRMALAALGELSALRSELEQERALSSETQRVMIDKIEATIAGMERMAKDMRSLEKKMQGFYLTVEKLRKSANRKGCPKYHAWDRERRRCTDRR